MAHSKIVVCTYEAKTSIVTVAIVLVMLRIQFCRVNGSLVCSIIKHSYN